MLPPAQRLKHTATTSVHLPLPPPLEVEVAVEMKQARVLPVGLPAMVVASSD